MEFLSFSFSTSRKSVARIKRNLAHCDNARTGKHISLTECFVISADVDSGDDKIFICFSNLWSLLSIARQINSGWDFVWHGDATFNFCRADAGLITLGHNSLGAHYHNLCWTIMGGSRETKQTYEQSYEALRRAAHLIFKLPVCCLEEEPVVRKKPKDPPRPEPLLRPSRPEDSEEDVSEEEPAAKQSQKTSIPRSAEKAKQKAEQQAKVRVTLYSRDVCTLY